MFIVEIRPRQWAGPGQPNPFLLGPWVQRAGLNGLLTSQWAGSGRAGWKNPSPWPYPWAMLI